MPRVSSPVFVGRSRELDRLWEAFEDAAAGRPATRLIAGEAGIGKTRLVSELMARASGAGARVLVGDCLRLGDTGLPYAPFVAALRRALRSVKAEELDRLIGPGRGELAHLLPDLGPAAPRPVSRPDASISTAAAQARLFEIIFAILRRLTDERPLVLVLEDVHWSDSSTRDLLRFLVRTAREGRFLFVATYRSDELHRRHPLPPVIAELSRLPHVDRVEVVAFDEVEIGEQLVAITGEPAAPGVAAALLARSGGNPFFAEELIAAGEVGLALPRSLRDTLIDRVRQHSEPAQAVLRVTAVAGGRVDHRLLATVSGLPAADLADAVREAVEHHVLEPAGAGEVPAYWFRHALLQEAVYEGLLPSERTQLHSDLARALEDHADLMREDPSGAAAQLAHHWFLAHQLDRALAAAITAGRAAAAGYAFTEADVLLERALELWEKVPAGALPAGITRHDVLVEAAEAAAQAGDPRRSIDLVRAALADTDPVTEPMRAGELHHRIAWYLNEGGDWQAGAREMERAVELIPIDPPSSERARVLSDLAHSLMVRGRFTDSLAVGEAALAISRQVGAQVAEARALNAIGLDIASRSDLERAIPMLRDGHERAVDLRDPQGVFLTSVGLGWALDEAGYHLESLDLAHATLNRLAELGAAARYGGQLASKASRALFELGRWDEAASLIDDTLAGGPSRYAVRWLLSNRVRLNIHRGQLDAARRDLRAYEALGERVVGPDPDLMGSRQAELAIQAGEPSVARDLVRDLLDRLAEPDIDTEGRSLLIIGLWAELEELEGAGAARDRRRLTLARGRAGELGELMARHIARVGELAARPAPAIIADGTLAQAICAGVAGWSDPDLWDATVAAHRVLRRPFPLARVLAAAAEAYLGQRRRAAAAAALAEAHEIAARLGAQPLRARVEALARRGRVPLAGVDSADTTADRFGLTPREREVLTLLAAGRSNRQIGQELFMAESTAGVHVGNILAKLGVTRRAEAAVIAHRIGLAGSA